MTYSRVILRQALRVFQSYGDDEVPALSPVTSERHLRDDYEFRQISNTQNISTKQVALFNEDSSSSEELDEYDSGLAKRKRRLFKAMLGSSKRAKRDGYSSPTCCRQEYLAIDPNATRALTTQRDHDRSMMFGKPDKFVPAQQYLERLDEEAAKIDNEHGRRLRNQKYILDEDRASLTERCLPCTRAWAKCIKQNNDDKCCIRCNKNRIECFKEDDICVEDSFVPQQPLKIDQTSLKAVPETPRPEAPVPAAPLTPVLIIGGHVASLQLQSRVTRDQEGSIHRKVNLGSSREDPIELDSSSDSNEPSPSPSLQRSHVTWSNSTAPSPPTDSDGVELTIRTTWAHPINFKHTPTDEEPCHFCSDFRYGIFGYGEIEVHVIKYSDSPDYEETGDGHRSEGWEPTRMCVKCSLSRLYISRCKAHFIIPFGIRSPELENRYISQLVEIWRPHQSKLKTGPLPTCSLCPRSAHWRCAADQQLNIVGMRIPSLKGKGKGCGLLLCDDCAPQVKEDGILRRPSIEQADMAKFQIGQRADVDFLFRGSLLHDAFR
ncbi:uncharacterized protein A1O9_06218 [Exophiala aquamarina CBS 119918]|uniref:Zn(2)-C6 fungal-type domain-containing protein n=1 Tax=Exophiala aquamarina CBS 119918 TaxID=1182545 RepID=A0A072PEY9_9EURO|nr:uncharacterized protein A1O9_06218 [Exophiala aquamarina CBS 119918]KEF58292.1 hypothetical protein A1O9_06218 [Exophiala aquamarina CBS 119918]